MNVYLDNAASTPTHPAVLAEIDKYKDVFGNPNALHSCGRQAGELINKARETIAKAINATAEEIVFTSGATESNNIALQGFMYANENIGMHIITTATEHGSVLNTLEYLEKYDYEITVVGVDEKGIVKLDELEKEIRKDTVLVSVIAANNELGTVNPIKEIGELCRKHGIAFHTDCVQAIGHIDIDVEEMNIDMLSLSGHKIYAPKGTGVLYVRKGIEIEPLIHGGGQENNQRAGTENVPGIIGIGKAFELLPEIRKFNLFLIKNRLKHEIIGNISDVRINGGGIDNILNVSFIGVNARELLQELDKKGVCVSLGSACSVNKNKPSHVLTAIGLDNETANSTIRFSFGIFNTVEEIDYVIDVLRKLVEKLRK